VGVEAERDFLLAERFTTDAEKREAAHADARGSDFQLHDGLPELGCSGLHPFGIILTPGRSSCNSGAEKFYGENSEAIERIVSLVAITTLRFESRRLQHVENAFTLRVAQEC
jgi:hypothetical protein